ncbi:hypothetical protein [Mesorhizobium sp. P5_C1]
MSQMISGNDPGPLFRSPVKAVALERIQALPYRYIADLLYMRFSSFKNSTTNLNAKTAELSRDVTS